MRNQIWGLLLNAKFKSYFVSLLIDYYQRWDRRINIFLAVASSTSIATWAIWKEYPLLWGGIIALSQVITAIKPFFPYVKYVKELNTKCIALDKLNIDLERLWYKSQNNKISDDEADELYFQYQQQLNELQRLNEETIIKKSDKMNAEADERMKVFIKTHYNITI